ncbi:MAG: ATP-binding protein [Chloroflexota bacterium]
MSDDTWRLGFADQGWVSVLILDHGCNILTANHAAGRLAGAAPDSLVGKTFCEVFADRPCMAAGGQPCPFVNARQGRERREQPRWLPIAVRGMNTTALMGARIVSPSELVSSTQWESKVTMVTMVPSSLVDEADRKRREMVAAAIHDMRHPLTMLGVTVEMLANAAGSGPRQLSDDALRRMQRATAQLTTHVDDLQNRLLFDSGVIKVTPRPLDVVPLVRQLAWQLEPLLSRRKQTISVVLPETLILWADPSALNQVLSNLLVNAHKYSIAGDTIEVSARRVPRRSEVEIRVRDHGLGVTQSDRRRIFERFYRGGDVLSIQGAGLGLAIVKSLIDSHGGKVGVGTPRGGGALFWVRLAVPETRWETASEEMTILTEP